MACKMDAMNSAAIILRTTSARMPPEAWICLSALFHSLGPAFAMARLPRASFALMLALLPASATISGAVVLAQIPSPTDCAASPW